MFNLSLETSFSAVRPDVKFWIRKIRYKRGFPELLRHVYLANVISVEARVCQLFPARMIGGKLAFSV